MAQSVYSDCWTDSTCAIIANYMASLQNLSVVEIQLWSGIAIAAPAVTTMIASPIWGS